MRKWYHEYIKSLKNPQVEEIFDLIFFRPLAFLVVKALYPFSITPNHLTFIAIAVALAGGTSFAFGTPQSFVIGAILIGLGNVIDCSDGMLARLKGNGTKIGRIVDGAADYLMSIGIYLGLTIGLSQDRFSLPYHPALLAIASGICAALHSIIFDYYRNEFMAHALKKVNSTNEEVEEYSEELERLNRTRGHGFEKMLIRIYLSYTKMQLKNSGKLSAEYDASDYARANRLALRLWSFIGSTTYITVLITATLSGRMIIFFFYSLVLANLWALAVWVYQLRILRRLNAKVISVEQHV